MRNALKNRAQKPLGYKIPVAFRHHGQDRVLKSKACAAMRCNPGPRFEALCVELGVVFNEMKSPDTERRVLVCTMSRLLTAIQTLNARRTTPPPIDGHPTGWLTELFTTRPSHATLIEWKKGCVHLDGDKYRAGRVPWKNEWWYGDVEQTERIKASLTAASKKQVLAERTMLTATEAEWTYKVTARQLRKWAKRKIIHPVDCGCRKLYPRIQIEQALAGTALPDGDITLAQAVPFGFTRAKLNGAIKRGELDSKVELWPGTETLSAQYAARLRAPKLSDDERTSLRRKAAALIRTRRISKAALHSLPRSKPRKTFDGVYSGGWFNLRAAVAQVEGISLTCLRQVVRQGTIRSEWRTRPGKRPNKKYKAKERVVQLADVIAYRDRHADPPFAGMLPVGWVAVTQAAKSCGLPRHSVQRAALSKDVMSKMWKLPKGQSGHGARRRKIRIVLLADVQTHFRATRKPPEGWLQIEEIATKTAINLDEWGQRARLSRRLRDFRNSHPDKSWRSPGQGRRYWYDPMALSYGSALPDRNDRPDATRRDESKRRGPKRKSEVNQQYGAYVSKVREIIEAGMTCRNAMEKANQLLNQKSLLNKSTVHTMRSAVLRLRKLEASTG